jgi:MYXO-CTERM domain-containing protein
MRSAVAVLALGLAAVAASPRDAEACGGCFHGPTQNGSVITDHRMIFRISPQQTTLYDEIEYAGDPAAFAWVLPIHAPVVVGLSSDVVFQALDSATAPQIQSPNPNCPSCGCTAGPGAFGGGGSSGSSGGFGGDDAGVVVISRMQVGPYDTVQLRAENDPTGKALEDWLAANGFVIPADVQPIVQAYESEKFDFLVLKLAPDQGVQAMRPVRVTSPGAGLTLPLRMVQAGTGPTVGITLWVIGDGRYEAQNFSNFTIHSSDLVWDWNTETSNYSTLQKLQESALGNAAWQTESSFMISPYQVYYQVTADPASTDYLAVPGSGANADASAGDDAATADGGDTGQTADEVRQADLDVLFPGTSMTGGPSPEVQLTRMRADLSRAALANDLVLQASADQSEVSTAYVVSRSVGTPPCPAVPNPCNCGGGPSSSSSSGGGFGGIFGGGNGSSGGSSDMGMSSGGMTMQATPPGHSAFGCSAAPTESSDAGVELAIAGLLGLSFVTSRRRRRPSSS